MSRIIDRAGETRINNFGSKMIITECRNAHDIDVYFPKYNWIAKNMQYKQFKNGEVKCPYEKRVYGIGYIGEGKYNTWKNGEHTKCYEIWKDMLRRCYSEEYHEKHPTYKDCEVAEEWLSFQNFAKWFDDNYYEIEGQKMELDKDILNKGNKIYSSDNCIFAPERINTLFVKRDKSRGKYPIGVTYSKANKKFQAKCNIYDYKENKNKRKTLGYYDTPQQAFEVYKQFKENYIKEVAEYYKDKIPQKLYDAMYKYEVDIDD